MSKRLVLCAFVVIVGMTSVSSSPFENYVNNRTEKSLAENDEVITPENNFVPIELIPGTQLYTGIYYKVGIQRFTSGWVTWTEKKHPTEGWHYMQIDGRADHMPNYRKSGIWYNDIQWFFVPSETEPGWYTLRNRQLPEYLACVRTTDSVDTGYHIALDKNANPTAADALWKPIIQNFRNDIEVYKLFVKSLPDVTITWTWATVAENVPDSHFIQADPDPNNKPKYAENQEWNVDTLFKFQAIDTGIEARISQVELLFLPKLDEIRRLSQIECEAADGLTLTNTESIAVVKELKQKVVNRGYLRLHLGDIPKMKIVASEGPVSPAWYADSIEFQMSQPEVKSTEEIRLKTVETTGVLTNVVVPRWTTTEVRVCREYFDTDGNNVNIDAFVYLDINENTERPLNYNRKFKAVQGKLPVDFVYQKVKTFVDAQQAKKEEENIENIDIRWEFLLMMAGDNSGLGLTQVQDTPGNTQILGKTDTEVSLRTMGVVKGRFGFRSLVASN